MNRLFCLYFNHIRRCKNLFSAIYFK